MIKRWLSYVLILARMQSRYSYRGALNTIELFQTSVYRSEHPLSSPIRPRRYVRLGEMQ